MDPKLMDDDDRLLRCTDARKFLADMMGSFGGMDDQPGLLLRQVPAARQACGF